MEDSKFRTLMWTLATISWINNDEGMFLKIYGRYWPPNSVSMYVGRLVKAGGRISDCCLTIMLDYIYKALRLFNNNAYGWIFVDIAIIVNL